MVLKYQGSGCTLTIENSCFIDIIWMIVMLNKNTNPPAMLRKIVKVETRRISIPPYAKMRMVSHAKIKHRRRPE